MWDEGLNGRFCLDCFDQVVDAEELLVSQGLCHARAALKPVVNNS
jgi:hypothetical protein